MVIRCHSEFGMLVAGPGVGGGCGISGRVFGLLQDPLFC